MACFLEWIPNTNRSIKDMACLINALCQQYAVDPTRLGCWATVMEPRSPGLCAEAQANIRAVVSLDSTREWDAECEPLYKDIAERLSQAISSMPPLSYSAWPNQRYDSTTTMP